MTVGEAQFGGMTFQVDYDVKEHVFSIACGDAGTAKGYSHDEAVVNAKKLVGKQRVRVEVPFVLIHDNNAVECVATGVHGRTNQVLYRETATKKAGQIEGYRGGTLGALDAGTLEKLRAALQKQREAARELFLITRDHEIKNLKTVVEEAMEAKLTKETARAS